MWTILFYSIFTFMCGIVTSVYQLAFLRILCGIGLGGEQPMGGTFVAEGRTVVERLLSSGWGTASLFVTPTALAALDADCPMLLYEAPHRVARTVADLGNTCGAGRRVALCRELTKLFEPT